MPPDAVICDWNGTLIEYKDERPILEHVAVDIFRASLPLHPLKAVRIVRARKELELLYENRLSDGELDFVKAMFHIYNGRIINGTPASLIRRSIDGFAGSPHTRQSLDLRVLRAIHASRKYGAATGILSAGFRYGIEAILSVSNHRRYFDFIVANNLIENNGKAVEFDLTIYKRKHETLIRLLNDRGIDIKRTAYIGDSEDDEGCFNIVGYPIMSFLAPQHLKDTFARKYNAFVPNSEHELIDHLVSA